jgi:DNA-binding MarR family transcriptional regulator
MAKMLAEPKVDPAPAQPGGAAALWARPGYLVRRLHQISVAIFLDEMSDLDLTPVQFGALTIIAGRPGIEQSVLGEEIGIDRVNAGDVVLRLIKNDLVQRVISPRDRRFKEVSLTAKGKAVLGQGTARMKRVQQRLLAPLDAAERKVFLGLLMQLINGNNDQGRAPLRLPKQGSIRVSGTGGTRQR